MKADKETTILFHLVVSGIRSLVFVGAMAFVTLSVMELQSVGVGQTLIQLESLGQSFGDVLN